MKPTIVFWYEFASTYSYLSAMRIEETAARADVAVDWKPFLLGPIFKSQGWETSPFNIYPAKGRYMVRDIGRTAASRGIPFQMPASFPANGLKAARLAIAARSQGADAAFSRAVFAAAFAKGLDISDDAVLTDCLTSAGLEADDMRRLSTDMAVKSELRANTEEAQALGIFGAPSFSTPDGEMFWGDDRLDQALTWARKRAPG
ncbi:2-hydroxychromene-2-carboxylate isomerase [Hyphomicrobium facile]|uniref:2-hydroxychromene-2-carboxylate isomerase n=1 Tax=Hyphomicrobium facile TaxID=51670 RepID=A0A1I7NSY5_9HYPH|nr:2-hydroxychromene-2-carboxylate isomerase [Hyphomicrobium facile]SFV37784.1 2-hydroxychromene-2-carboxylate isomerase [Hyphomicrobium facile]